MSQKRSNTVHFFAGGIGGATGVLIAFPLDVVKTRQQSSVFRGKAIHAVSGGSMRLVEVGGILTQPYSSSAVVSRPGVLQCFKLTVQNEGLRAFYKGLTPALAGVVPYRAIYFATYSKTKRELKRSGLIKRDSSLIPPIAGCIAGAASVTITCPIWVIKTRLQLDKRKRGCTLSECISRLFHSEGVRGFYRGLFISYIGLLDTMIQFYLYELLKKHGRTSAPLEMDEFPGLHCFSTYAFAACASKVVSTTACYPHEVIRTRLRQPLVGGKKLYVSTGQTLLKVAKEEGFRGFYGGLSVQLLRMIPHSVAMLVVYEAVVSICNDHT